MEHKIAMYLVNKLNKIYPRTEVENVKMVYGLEIILDNIIKLAGMLIIANVLGFFRETLIVIIGFGILRLNAGGVHLDKSISCLICSICITVGGGFLANLNVISGEVSKWMLVLALIIVIIYAPSGTSNNPINPKYKKILKIRSIITILIYLLVTFLAKSVFIANALAIGAGCEVITILPIMNMKYQIENGKRQTTRLN